MVLVCISLMANDVLIGHLCIYFGEMSIQMSVFLFLNCHFIAEL